MDRQKVIKAWEIFRDSNPYEICSGREFRAIREPEYCMGQMIEDTISMLKEQEAEISNYKEVIENLLQQLQDINKYMTPIGMVSDVRAYIEGREQPEIIRCYACKHGEKVNDVYLCGKARGFGIAHDPAWFCADGEKR